MSASLVNLPIKVLLLRTSNLVSLSLSVCLSVTVSTLVYPVEPRMCFGDVLAPVSLTYARGTSDL